MVSWRGDSKYLFGDRRSITAVSAGCSGAVVECCWCDSLVAVVLWGGRREGGEPTQQQWS